MESIPTSKVGLKKMIRTTGKAKTDTTKGMVFLPKTTNKAQNISIEIKAEGRETKRAVIIKASMASPFPSLKKGYIWPSVADPPPKRAAKRGSKEKRGAERNKKRVGMRIFTPSMMITLILSLLNVCMVLYSCHSDTTFLSL